MYAHNVFNLLIIVDGNFILCSKLKLPVMKYLLMVITFFVGAVIPIQAILNTRLGRQTGGALMGALMSFFTGTVALFVLNLVVSNHAMMNLKQTVAGPWYIWLGGLIGAIFVGYITWINQQQGVALTFALVVAGQIFISLLIDHFGLFGSAIRTITLEKIIGAAFIIAGIILIKK
jgi:bacterial/archaeal transporter family-2 protein